MKTILRLAIALALIFITEAEMARTSRPVVKKGNQGTGQQQQNPWTGEPPTGMGPTVGGGGGWAVPPPSLPKKPVKPKGMGPQPKAINPWTGKPIDEVQPFGLPAWSTNNAWTGQTPPNAWTGAGNQQQGYNAWTGQAPAFGQQQATSQQQQMQAGSFFAGGGGQQVRQGNAVGGARVIDRTKGTRQVRTGNNTMTEVPLEPGMLTGTFFSGGETPTTPDVPLYPTGTFFAGGGTMVQGPGWQPAATTNTGGSPFSSYYTGWGKGGGGGGYSYNNVPSWLLNLYNWNFKG